MSDPIKNDDMPKELDFSKGVRGLHHIPSDAKVFFPPQSSAAFGNISP